MDKIQKRVQKDLEKDEVVLVSTKGSPLGFAEEVVFSAANKMANPKLNHSEVNIEDQFINGKNLSDYNQVIVGITEQRILFWSANFFSKPGKLISSIKRSAVESLQETKTKMAFASMSTLEIVSKSGEKIELQVAKIHHKKAKEIISIFNS